MSRSNYDKPFYVDVGTSIAAVRCASDGEIVAMYDHVLSGRWAIEEAERICDKLNSEAKTSAGNTAEMRETLVWMKERMNAAIHDGSLDCDEASAKIDAALSAPPRNCDVYKDFNKAIRKLADIRDWHDGRWDSERYCILASWLLADANCKGA